MNRTLGRLLLLGSGLVCLVFVVVAVNQTAQVVQLARLVHPLFGSVVLWTLLTIYSLLVAIPLLLLLRLPSPLAPPASVDAPEFPRFFAMLRKRLARNPRLADRPLQTVQDVEAALRGLDAEADAISRRTASAVFLSTAISQTGSLEGILVLAAQSRMIWQISHLYWQRPTLRELYRLYANVAATTLLASGIEDADLGDQIAPLVTAAVGGAAGAIPGFQSVTSVLTGSLLSGSANAYLTLRVGVITRRYCSSLVALDRRAVRRAAALEAAGMLAGVAQENVGRITKAVLARTAAPVTAVAKMTASAGRDVAGAVSQAVLDALAWLRRKGARE